MNVFVEGGVFGSMRRAFRFALCAIFLLSAGLAPESPARAQEAPCHQDELESLSILVGSWEVEAEVRLSQAGPWESSSANAEIARELEGCVFVERLSGTRQGRPFEARTILAWHPLRQVVQRLFVDSDHGLLLIAEGDQGATAAVGNDLEVYADIESALGPVRLRTAYRDITPDGFHLESARSVDGGATWDVTSRLRYWRAGSAARDL